MPPTPVEVIDEPEIIASLLIQNGLVPKDKTAESVIQGQHFDRTKEPSDKLENNQTNKTGEKLKDCSKCKYCLDKPKNGGIGKLKKACVLKTKMNKEIEKNTKKNSKSKTEDKKESSVGKPKRGRPPKSSVTTSEAPDTAIATENKAPDAHIAVEIMKDSDERNDKPENTTNKKENKINTNTEPAEKPKRGRPPKSLTKTAAQKRKLENVADTDAAAIYCK